MLISRSSLGGWTVLGFDECSAVLKDDSTFVMAWSTLEGGDAALGKYGIFNLTGEAHAQAHKELLDFFNPRKNLALRPAVRRHFHHLRVAVIRDEEISPAIQRQSEGNQQAGTDSGLRAAIGRNF